jgi:putative phosphoribosyl transferase
MSQFRDRAHAGRELARSLEGFRGQDLVVLGLPRGGVPVAFEVATALDAPLDVVVVRKLGVPFQPELAMGAVGELGARVVDRHLMAMAGITTEELAAVERRERAELERRVAQLRRGHPRVPLAGRVAVVVDDGMATGSTARAACQVVRELGAARVVLAVPVAPRDALGDVVEADEVVCVATPHPFLAVGRHYSDFTPTNDAEVVMLLDLAARRRGTVHRAPDADGCDIDVEIPTNGVVLQGHLHLHEPAQAVVVFVHGSGSSRYSPRNRFVADRLYEAGLGTLLVDLLTPDEERDRTNVFDVDLLADRLAVVTGWLADQPATAVARLGYFGASTGAAAALWAAAEPTCPVEAIVSRGGRPDLAAPRLELVRAPTLLVVGSRDEIVLDLNHEARRQLRCEHSLAVVDGATHLFEEPGALAEVAALARRWFTRYLR